MKVGITGHQSREGIDWTWVKDALTKQLEKLRPDRTLSSLAEGTDQIFAEVALNLNIPLIAVIPLDGYERFFSPEGLVVYSTLLAKAERRELRWIGDAEHAFLNAGKYISDHCDMLMAVWDGRPADGLGGTADVVDYSISRNRAVLHINPCDESIQMMPEGRR